MSTEIIHTRQFRTHAAKKDSAFVVFVRWLLFVGFLTPCTAFANMPQPTTELDYYLVGVDKVIVSANTAVDPEYLKFEIHEHKIPNLDFPSINQSIADQIRTSLPENVKGKIEVQAMQDTPLRSGSSNRDENALILHLAFGYHVTEFGDRQIVLGAVYATVERLPPKSLMGDRVSGFQASFILGHVPAPFLMDGDPAAVNQSVSQATDRCVKSFIAWIAKKPLQMPERTKEQP